MQKFNRCLIVFVLIFVAFIFASCTNSSVDFDINVASINLLVDERYELKLENIEESQIEKLDFSFTNSEIAYVIPKTSTIVGIKSGTTIMQISNGEKTKSIVVNVLPQKTKLNTPSELKLNREEGKIEWASVPMAEGYNLKIKFENTEKTIFVANNFVDVEDIENFQIVPNKAIVLSVQALPSENNKNVYESSDFSSEVCYNELPAVSNLAFNTQNSTITFSYDEASSVYGGNEVYFYVTISGEQSDVIRVLKNETNNYSLNYNFEKSGNYQVSVKALIFGRNTSVSKTFEVIKLNSPVIYQDGQNVVFEALEENANVCLSATNQTQTSKKIEKVGSEFVGEVVEYFATPINLKIVKEKEVYYLNSDLSNKTIKKLNNISNFDVFKASNTSISLEWEKVEGVEYLIYENNQLINLNQTEFEKNNKQFLRAVKENIKDGENLEYFIVATLQQTDNDFYLNSEKTLAKQVHKLSAPTINFNNQTNEINFSALEENSNLQIKMNNNLFEVAVGNPEENFEIKNSYLTRQQNSLTILLNKTSEEIVYLPSETLEYTIIKSSSILPEIEKFSDAIQISFEQTAEINEYSVILNEIKLSTANSEGIYYSLIKNKQIVSISVKNLTQSGNYNLKIKGIGSYNNQTKTFIVATQEYVLNFSKLETPNLNLNKNGNLITFGWNNVLNATNYEIKIKNLSNNNNFVDETAQNEYAYTFANAGSYQVEVVAKSEQNIVLNSKPEQVNVTKLNTTRHIANSVEENNCIITFDQVEGAEGYKVFVLKGGNKVYENNVSENVDFIDISKFNEAGTYSVQITTISNKNDVINSEIATYVITKLNMASSVNVNSYNGVQRLNISYLNPTSKFLYSLDGAAFVEIDTNRIDVSNLSLGRHSIEVICIGNDENYLNSDAKQFEFNIKEVLSAPTDLNLSYQNEEFVLSFIGDENAEEYIVQYLRNYSTTVFERTISKNEQNEYQISFERADFVDGNSTLKVISSASESNEKYISSASVNLAIVKANSSMEIGLTSNQLNLINKQAYIGNVEHTNKMLDLSYLESGEEETIKVRNINGLNAIDDYSQGIFYIASAFSDFSIYRFITPVVTLNEDSLSFDCLEQNEFKARIYLDFYGQNQQLQYQKQFDLSQTELSNGLNIKTYIDRNLRYQNKVGDFKIFVDLRPTQANSSWCLTSLKSQEINYTYTETLSNTSINSTLNKEGNFSLTVSVSEMNKFDCIAIEFEQNNLTTTFNLGVDGISNLVNGLDLNISEEMLTISRIGNNYKFDLNIFELFNSGDFVLNYKAIGDDVYYISAQENVNRNIKKLDTPEFTYDCDINGNKLILTEQYLQDNSNVSVYAEYENSKRVFAHDGLNYCVYLPYEWQDLSKIKVYATSYLNSYLNSNNANVSFVRANTPTNLHLEENSQSGKTYLTWSADADEYYVFIYQNNTLTNTLTTSLTNVEILDEYINAGEVEFEVVAAGYTKSGQTCLNSNIASLFATKLENQIEINNTNGILGWSGFAGESQDIKEYRLKILNNLYNFNTNIHSFNMNGLDGYLEISFKIVGNPQRNIISSNYQNFNVFKYSAPTSFKVLDGQFNINEAIEEDVEYIIKIGTLTFDYNKYVNYDASLKTSLYFQVANMGTAQAKIEVKTNDLLIHNSIEYLALSSDFTDDVSYSMLEIDVSNDEFYLTQTTELGEVNTYFNYEWIDSSFKDSGKIRVFIRPKFTVNSTLIGWNKTTDENSNVIVYFKDITFNNEYDNGIYQKSYLCEMLPKDLKAGEYMVEIQKTSIGVNSNLSSKIVEVLKFTKLRTLSTRIAQGRITWNEDRNVEYYLLNYEGNTTGWKQIEIEYYEPDGSFADSNLNQTYSYSVFACGNVSELKPEQNLNALSKNYIVSSDINSGTFTKLKDVGDLQLSSGVLNFVNQDNNYYEESNITSKIEIYFLNTSLKPLTSVVVDAEALTQTPPDEFFENHLTSAQKNILQNAGNVIIKYRQLGQTFTNFINSEYKFLTGSGFSIIVGANNYDYFEFLNTPLQIGISETEGLTFSAELIDLSKMSTVNYDVYYIKDNSANIELLTTTQNNYIEYNEFKELLQNNDALAAEIFVVARGNGYYLSSFKSPSQKVRMANGVVGLSCSNGNLVWNKVDDASYYVLKRELDDDYIVYYFKKEGDDYYYKTNSNSTFTKTAYLSENNGQLSLNVSLFEIPDGDNTFNLRYEPSNSGNVFAIPSVWSNSVRTYKVAMPDVVLNDGVFEWQHVANNNGYKFIVERGNQVVLEKDLDVLSYTINIDELSSLDPAFSNTIRYYKFKIQAKGKDQSENGIYFISSAAKVFENLGIKQNDVNNVMLNGDIISWEDSNQNEKYILNIVEYNQSNESVSTKTIIVDATYYDLANANLSGDTNSTYQVSIKVCGDSNNLASKNSVSSNTFKVLPSISDIQIENGYIKFKTQQNAKEYVVSLGIDHYTISIANNHCQVISVTQTTAYGLKTLTVEELDVKMESGYIYFWPNYSSLTSGTWLDIKAKGYSSDSITFVSSQNKRFNNQVSKVNISSSMVAKIVYSNNILSLLNIKLNMLIPCELSLELYQGETKINNVNYNYSITNDVAKIEFTNLRLAAGEYKIKFFVTPIGAGSTRLKSDVRVLSFNLK